MATIWKKAVEAVEVGEDTGDILAPLKRVYMKYVEHGARLVRKATKQDRALSDNEKLGLAYYTESAAAVRNLLGE